MAEYGELIVMGLSLLGAGGVYFFYRRKPPQQDLPPVPPTPEVPPIPEDLAEPSVEPPPPQPEPPAPPPSRKEYKTLEEALVKTKEGFWGRLADRLSGKPSVSSDEIEDLEEVLYTSDLGPKTVDFLLSKVSETMGDNGSTVENLHKSLKNEINGIFSQLAPEKRVFQFGGQPTVWMVVGVNGAGKTTTIGKLASQQVEKGKKVIIAAGDTFRAAADEQLKVWATRAEVEIFSPENVKDPSAVAFDAIQKAKSKDFDLVIIDTAGRLHTQKNLMEELKKMKRVMDKALPGAPHETLLVLDANSGQNALMQTEQFHQALEVSGVILTKMDGSAKGGVAVGIACEHKLPIKMIGVGEKIEDLRPFSASEFVDSII